MQTPTHLIGQIKSIKWIKILLFYGVALGLTFVFRQLPNVLNIVLPLVTDIQFSFNYNHGIAVSLVAFCFYKFGNTKQTITLLGDKWQKALLFPAVFFGCYVIHGISNQNGIDTHVWALIFCSFVLVYNLMEEYAWRGYLVDSLGNVSYTIKSIVSAIFWACWHLLVFNDFNQYGGFGMFVLFCLIFSFILTYAVKRTNSILVAACMHGFIIQTNIAAIICLSLFVLLLVTWNTGEKRNEKQEIVIE